jgi:hypothetical protein
MLKKVYRPVVGEVAATVLVNGRIVGSWTSKKKESSESNRETSTEKTLISLKPVADELAQFVGVKEAQIALS